MNVEPIPSISDLYPNLSQEEQERSAANIRRYIQIICRIHARLQTEGKRWPTAEEARRIYGFPDELTESSQRR